MTLYCQYHSTLYTRPKDIHVYIHFKLWYLYRIFVSYMLLRIFMIRSISLIFYCPEEYLTLSPPLLLKVPKVTRQVKADLIAVIQTVKINKKEHVISVKLDI